MCSLLWLGTHGLLRLTGGLLSATHKDPTGISQRTSAKWNGNAYFQITHLEPGRQSVISSQEARFWSEIEDLNAHIPEGKLEYLRERLRNELYDFVLTKFLEQQGAYGLNKAQLARRIGYDPGRLNRLLGAPGNWTLGTVSDLLVGISGEVLVLNSSIVPTGPPRNMSAHDWLQSGSHLNLQTSEARPESAHSRPTITAHVE